MTEISWLRQRNYFINKGIDTKLLLVFAAISLFLLLTLDLEELGFLGSLSTTFVHSIKQFYATSLFSALFIALILTLPLKRIEKIIFTFIGIGIGLFFSDKIWFLVIIGIFIPTLIHTTVFTGAFMLEGAMKHKKKMGYAAFIVFMLCSVFFFIVPNLEANVLKSIWIQEMFLDSDFYYVSLNFYNLFYSGESQTFVLDSAIGTRIQGFIAFSYTYHYLNWFSKTEVIKWHHIPRPWLILSVGVWLVSIILHLIDMKIGILFIASLSLLHVYLEFPLNHRSFQSIGSRILQMVRK